MVEGSPYALSLSAIAGVAIAYLLFVLLLLALFAP
jgi:hypothetical protein